MLTTFASCGDSSSSSDSSETSENSISKTTTEKDTVTKEINPFLDKKISCDYLSFYAPSKWNPDIGSKHNEYFDFVAILFEWEDQNEIYHIIFDINNNEMDKNKDYKDYSKYKVLDKFTISGQEYVMIQPEKEV